MGFITILLLVALIVWIYVDVNSAKATGRWVVSGAKGVASDVNAIKAEVKQKQVENPNRQEDIFKMLNDDVLDMHGYSVSARARSVQAHSELNSLIAKHSK
jgi:hypothetical protein